MKKYSVLVKRFTEEYCRVEVHANENANEETVKDMAIERAFDQGDWSLGGQDYDVETAIEEVTDDEDR